MYKRQLGRRSRGSHGCRSRKCPPPAPGKPNSRCCLGRRSRGYLGRRSRGCHGRRSHKCPRPSPGTPNSRRRSCRCLGCRCLGRDGGQDWCRRRGCLRRVKLDSSVSEDVLRRAAGRRWRRRGRGRRCLAHWSDAGRPFLSPDKGKTGEEYCGNGADDGGDDDEDGGNCSSDGGDGESETDCRVRQAVNGSAAGAAAPDPTAVLPEDRDRLRALMASSRDLDLKKSLRSLVLSLESPDS